VGGSRSRPKGWARIDKLGWPGCGGVKVFYGVKKIYSTAKQENENIKRNNE